MKEFEEAFYALTSHTPMLWQRRLFERFVTSSIPSACDVPTGLGKTSVMGIWLLALARQAMFDGPSLPRRLVYVVNRRTVVDQASEEAASYQRALRDGSSSALGGARDALLRLCVDPQDSASPLAVSTLRGELADNRAWQADPCRATIIVGTVDLIGSRLLFSGYRSGWKMRAFDAGLMGQDALLVHDEAHLSPAFSTLGKEVARVQRDGGEGEARRALRVLELSATQRAGDSIHTFSLTEAERTERLAARRLGAAKSLRIHDLPETDNDLPSTLVGLALEHRGSKTRVLVYVRQPESAHKIAVALRDDAGAERVALLTGTLRGHERDALDTSNAAYMAFRAGATRPPIAETMYLVATSAGEVGTNLDADHLVCDVTTLESMIQRFGRVNRLGRDDGEFVAHLDAVFERWRSKKKTTSDDGEEGRPPLEVARDETVAILRRLPPCGDGHDASPGALRAVLDDPAARRGFAPPTPELPCTDVLLDAWALTSIQDSLPGRPPVHPYLHGVENDPPETVVAWREEVMDLVELVRSGDGDVVEWLDAHRLLAREMLTDSPVRVAKVLIALAKQLTRLGTHLDVLVIPRFGRPFVLARPGPEGDAKELARQISDATVLLPPTAGGLDDSGMLAEPRGRIVVADVADVRSDPARARRRVRLERNEDGDWIVSVLGDVNVPAQSTITASTLAAAIQQLGAELRRVNEPCVEKIRLLVAESEDGPVAALVSFGMPRQPDTALDSSAAAPGEQSLLEHLDAAGEAARRIARRASLDEDTARALVVAARWHDVGKNRIVWQRAIGNSRVGEPLAKTSHGRFDYNICPGYRHELGSLLDATFDPEIAVMPERDLVLHLIASHHARSRPHFLEVAWDPAATDEQNRAAAADAIRRYVRLQRRFGRWGLAWLEALMKCSDVVATLRGTAVRELPE